VTRRSTPRSRRRSSRAEAWRTLRVGELIRIVRVPEEFDEPGYVIAPDTRRLFARLVAERRSHRIAWIDDWGVPSIDLRFRRTRSGTLIHESLDIIEDCWVRVRRRRGRPHARIGGEDPA
jgi:hypothetical protein